MWMRVNSEEGKTCGNSGWSGTGSAISFSLTIELYCQLAYSGVFTFITTSRLLC
jgi:hypothetical protein